MSNNNINPTQADEAKESYGPVIEVPLRELDSGTLASMVTALRNQLEQAHNALRFYGHGSHYCAVDNFYDERLRVQVSSIPIEILAGPTLTPACPMAPAPCNCNGECIKHG
jgi:hypothetical protein